MATNWYNNTGIPKLYRCTECWEFFEADEFDFYEEKCHKCTQELKSNKFMQSTSEGG